MKPLVSIFIPTYNRDKILFDNLKKLSELDHYMQDDYEVVVYNNFSTDNTHQAIEEARKFFKTPETIQSFSQTRYDQHNNGCEFSY